MKEKESLSDEGTVKNNLYLILKALNNSDNKIHELQNFSSKDFTHLNQHFLSFHKKAKNLISSFSEFTSELLNNETYKESTIRDVSNEIKEIPKYLVDVNNNLKQLSGVLFEINDKIEFNLVPLNNYKQNLITLKLLSSNLKFDKRAVENNIELVEGINKIILILDNIGMFFPKIEKYTEEYKTSNNILIQNIKTFLSDVTTPFLGDVKQISSFFSDFFEKLNNIKSSFKNIETNKKESQQHVDSIITNLQYQDIIRQRIEHIEEIHIETIKELTEFMGNEDEHNNKKDIVFSKIKDIVGLQSAQLIHINKEFQSAIETIFKKIKEYNKHVSSFNDTSLYIIENFLHQDKSHELVSNNTNKFKDTISKLSLFLGGISKNIQDNHLKSVDLSKYLNEVLDINKQIERLNKTVDGISSIKTLEKISEILNDNIKISGQIEKNILELELLNTKATDNFSDLESNCEKLSTAIDTIDSKLLQNNIKTISQSICDIQSMIQENKEDQIQINGVIHDLQYYQFFEKNVDEIILSLNEIVEVVEKLIENDEIKISNNIDHIKDRYTTENEHTIHKEYSENKNEDDDLTNVDNKDVVNADIDNFELF